MERNALNSKIVSSALITSLHSFIFGMNLAILSTYKEIFVSNKRIASFMMTETEFKHAVCVICLGALLSNLCASLINIKRKNFLIINGMINLIGQLCIKFAFSSFFIICARFIIGIGAGLTTGLVPLYHLKLAPLHLKGLFGSLNQLFCVIGVFFAQVFSFYFNKESNWQIGQNFTLLFVGLHFLSCFFIIKVEENSVQLPNKNIIQLISNPNARKSILIITMILIGQQISGIKSIIFYSEEIFKKTGNSHLYTAFLGISLILGTIVSMFIIDKAGRKKLLLISSLVAAGNLFLLALNKFIFFAIFGFVIGYSIGLGPIPWFIAGEGYPEDYKKAGSTLGISANWLTNYTVALNFPILLNYSTKHAFLPLFSALVFLFFFILILFPETKGRKIDFL